MRRSLMIAAALVVAAPALALAASWGEVRTPIAGPPHIIGGPADGCIAGAVPMPLDGLGYEVIRVSRNRYYGHPDTIAFLARLARRANASVLPPFYIGDIGQPRGGPMSFGHGSHQNGLDADIWFNLDPKPLLRPAAREDVDLPSMVLPSGADIDRHRFGERQVRLLRMAASDPKVDRIFVHPTIKRALCEGFAGAREGDRSWIHKIRPWRGHDEHFHVRLTCPANSPDCVQQPPVPPGDGCDASLDWWFDHPPAPPSTKPQKHWAPNPKLPLQCRAVLGARDLMARR
jgi:penicillin-insensitive murein DD-endopeptidase